MALIFKKFRRFMNRRRQGFKKRTLVKEEPSKDKEKEKEQLLCYEYKKMKYFKTDHPIFKKSD